MWLSSTCTELSFDVVVWITYKCICGIYNNCNRHFEIHVHISNMNWCKKKCHAEMFHGKIGDEQGLLGTKQRIYLISDRKTSWYQIDPLFRIK